MSTASGGERKPTLVSLFSGAGGLDAGLERAGFHTVSATDFDANCMKTLAEVQSAKIPVRGQSGSFHLDGTRLIHASAEDISPADLRPAGANSRWRPDVLSGGPPCQPFSSAGRQRGIEDPRGKLFLEFVSLADQLKPRIILFENVRGLVTAKTPDGEPGGVLRMIRSSFEEIGYATRFKLLNAADFGAPQRRIRLFMIAAKDRALPDFPEPTHSRDAGDTLLGSVKPWVSLGEFLSGQPAPDPSEIIHPTGSLIDELANLVPGTGVKSGGIVEANRPSGHWGYRQDRFLADLKLPARTIRAATTPDWIRLEDGSMRRLSWRECAALQGFPREWAFQGTTASKFRQIGNAVQAEMAEKIGLMLMRSISSSKRVSPVSASWPAEFHKWMAYTAMEHNTNGKHRAAAREKREKAR
ncbi:DNA cytosine methyltransferase [Streptomyces sp. NPDC050418]|uniref:DNA cytosine methyltransferase n=1 Tax=Streptomyces sp. NPDC050418 TaxID=3365612 RepID=UPI00379B81A0